MKNQIKAPVQSKTSNVDWLNYKLNEDDRAQFAAWQPESDELYGAVVQMISEGFRFTCSYDKYNQAIQVSVVCPVEGHELYNRGFSTYAKSWEKVWALTVFKHFTLFQQKWPKTVERTPGADFN